MLPRKIQELMGKPRIMRCDVKSGESRLTSFTIGSHYVYYFDNRHDNRQTVNITKK